MTHKISVVSGGFDPVHKGHVKMIQQASKFGSVYVLLNTDEWLVRKKKCAFMDWQERATILLEFRHVFAVLKAIDDDDSVCESLKILASIPDVEITFCNGGDRKDDNVPEVQLCKELGINLEWNVGGEKIQSSSELIKKCSCSSEDRAPTS